VDHIVPIMRGGVHSYANVQLAHPRCNRMKGAKIG
jgi:5-methylcytosine-specific restriction endonuclease McrA